MPRASAGAASSAGLVAGRVECVAEEFLDARKIDDALAQHRFRDKAELRVGLRARRGRARRHDEAHERVVEAVLDADQRRRDRDQRVLLGGRAARDDVGEPRQLALHLFAHGSEPEHRERVADLLEEIHLRRELLRRAALARVEVERVLDATEILLDGGRDRAHEAHRRGGQRLALLLDGFVDRQELAQAEGASDRIDALAAGRRARHVKKQVVQQFDRRRIRIGLFALRIQALQLAVGMAEQALDGDARLEAAVPQRIDETSRDPPELVQRRGCRDRFHAVCDVGECGEAAVLAIAADEAEQPRLEPGPEAPRPLRHGHPRLGGRCALRGRRFLRAQVQREQRALGQERCATHGAQVIQQRQQDERKVAPAAQHALEVGWQLHARAHQRIEPVHELARIGLAAGEPARGLFHLLGEESCTVDFDDAQHAARGAHELGGLGEVRPVGRRLRRGLERDAHVVQRRGQLARDEMQCLLVDRGEAGHS